MEDAVTMGRKRRTMIVARDLGIHRCHACGRPLSDNDFTSCGVSVRPEMRIFFEYLCRSCAHRDRHIFNVVCGARPVEALQFLLTVVKNGESGGKTGGRAGVDNHPKASV